MVPILKVTGFNQKITKGPVLAGLGRERVKKERWADTVGPVNHFPPRGSPLTSKIVWRLRESKIIKGPVLVGSTAKRGSNYLGPDQIRGPRKDIAR